MADVNGDHGLVSGAMSGSGSGNRSSVSNQAGLNDQSHLQIVFSTDSNPGVYTAQQTRGGVMAQQLPNSAQQNTSLNSMLASVSSYPQPQSTISQLASNSLPANFGQVAGINRSGTQWTSFPRPNSMPTNGQNSSSFVPAFNNQMTTHQTVQSALSQSPQQFSQFGMRGMQIPQLQQRLLPVNPTIPSSYIPIASNSTSGQNLAPFPQTASMYTNVFYPAAQPDVPTNIPLTRSQAAASNRFLNSANDASSSSAANQIIYNTIPSSDINLMLNTPADTSSKTLSRPSSALSSSSSASSDWHLASHEDARADMQTEISKILRNRRTNPDISWLAKLPVMAKRLEQTLFDSAPSLDQYCDKKTLRFRLHQVAQNMQPRGSVPLILLTAPSVAEAKQQPDVILANTTLEVISGGKSSTPSPPAMLRRSSSSVSSDRILNMDSQTNMEASVNLNIIPAAKTTTETLPAASEAKNDHITRQMTLVPLAAAAEVKNSIDMTHQPLPLRMSEHVLAMFAQRRAELSEDEKKQLIRQERHRLLLLRHASKCTYEAQQCPTHPLCYKMKSLWKHICDCKMPQCSTPHCNSSRTALSHYGRCTDHLCAICAPVKQAIHERQMKNEKLIEKIEKDKKPVVLKSLQLDQLDPISCRLYALDEVSILSHVDSLRLGVTITSASVRSKCLGLVNKLLASPNGHYFKDPVDPSALGIPDYISIVKNVMDLGTIRRRLDNGSYRDYEEVRFDVLLTFDNALLYNTVRSQVHGVAKDMKREFEKDWKNLKKEIAAETPVGSRENTNICYMCAKAEMNFESPIYYCNGPCGGSRIKRANVFYQSPGGNYHYCVACYTSMKEGVILNTPGEGATFKSKLIKKKNEDKIEEMWVECSECVVWCHTVCALFNNRRNMSDDFPYLCHSCVLKKRGSTAGGQEGHISSASLLTNVAVEAAGSSSDRTKAPPLKGARELPETKLSMFIQKRVMHKLKEEYETRQPVNPEHNEENGFVTGAPDPFVHPVFVRQMLATDKPQIVRQSIVQRYSDSYCRQMNGIVADEESRDNGPLSMLNLTDSERMQLPALFQSYPEEFSCRVKCISLFQNLSGIDVLLFVMYCYEYSHKCPQPNHRRVYVSYLDSCHYFQPRQYRTVVYHEILVAYLDYCKSHGFHSAHIWACPPAKGDDYILHVHPQDQKTPLDSRLQKWYLSMLDEGKRRKVIETITTMHDVYFKPLKECRNCTNGIDHCEYNDASILPYFEGDYWIGEADKLILGMSEGNRGWTNDFISPDAVLAASNFPNHSHVCSDINMSQISSSSSMHDSDKKSKRKSKTSEAIVAAKIRPGGRPHSSRAVSGLIDPAAVHDVKASGGLPVAARDPIMANLSKTIEGMKEAFLVVYLLSPEFAVDQWRRRVVELRIAQVDKFRQARGTIGSMHNYNLISANPSLLINRNQSSRLLLQPNMASRMGEMDAPHIGSFSSNFNAMSPNVSADSDFSAGNSEEEVLRGCKFDGLEQVSAMIQLKAETDEQHRLQLSAKQSSMNDQDDLEFAHIAEAVGAASEQAMDEAAATPVSVANGSDSECGSVSDNADGDSDHESNSNTKRKHIDEEPSDARKRSRTGRSGSNARSSSSSKATRSLAQDQVDEDNGGSSRRLRQRPVAKLEEESNDNSDSSSSDSDYNGDNDDGRVVPVKGSRLKRSNKTSSSSSETLHVEKRSRLNSSPVPCENTTVGSFDSAHKDSSMEVSSSVTDDVIVAMLESKNDSQDVIIGSPITLVPGNSFESSAQSGINGRDETEDSDDDMENEFFDTRQEFLTLCQGNHYQFDQLRRAKHSTMLVLYHLHNPDAPKYLPSCYVCHKSIIGIRWQCIEHKDYDVCNKCVALKCEENGVAFERDSQLSDPPKVIGYGFLHNHKLTQTWVGDKSSTTSSVAQSGDSSSGAQHRQSRQMGKMYMILLNHAVNCKDVSCTLPNCLKMKTLLGHFADCDVGLRKGCLMCKKCFNVLQLHARQCRATNCNVPKCRDIKLHNRQLMAHQQAMDDRRRAKMNEMLSEIQNHQTDQKG